MIFFLNCQIIFTTKQLANLMWNYLEFTNCSSAFIFTIKIIFVTMQNESQRVIKGKERRSILTWMDQVVLQECCKQAFWPTKINLSCLQNFILSERIRPRMGKKQCSLGNKFLVFSVWGKKPISMFRIERKKLTSAKLVNLSKCQNPSFQTQNYNITLSSWLSTAQQGPIDLGPEN